MAIVPPDSSHRLVVSDGRINPIWLRYLRLAGTGTAHTHDDRYYTEAEVDALIAAIDLTEAEAKGFFFSLMG